MNRFDDYKRAMDMVKEVEQGPVSKFSAETRCFADLVRAVDFYHLETRKRLRTVAQILIAEIGAGGPQNAEVVAANAVQLIKNLRVEVCSLRENALRKESEGVMTNWSLEREEYYRRTKENYHCEIKRNDAADYYHWSVVYIGRELYYGEEKTIKLARAAVSRALRKLRKS